MPEGKRNLRASISIKQGVRLDSLTTVLTSLTLERLMRLAERILVEQEQLPERVEGEVSFHVLVLVDDRGREGLLVRLPLEDLFCERKRSGSAL